MRKWEWFRQAQPNGFGVGGVVHAAGCGFRRACPWGGQRTLSRTHGRERMDGAQMGVASDWVGLSASTGSAQHLQRVVGFSGRVRGGKPSTNENHEPSANGRCANGSSFDKLNPTASGWVGLSTSTGSVQRLRRILGFGGRVYGMG